jgi:hypothetical protein
MLALPHGWRRTAAKEAAVNSALVVLALGILPAAAAVAAAEAPDDPSAWTVYVANDNCPDYTWGLTEPATRQAFADVVRGHLDEMKRTDAEPPENQDRYNAAVTQEVLCFVEKYPDRKDELVRRIKEGRLYVSPYLCNSLWGFQGVEGVLRTFYPARRLERQWGIAKIEIAEHIEEPSLPWGTTSILAGCGIRWLSNPFYSYDSTFGGLRNPPVFTHVGPDGSRLRVVMDPWASNGASYTQGAKVLSEPKAVAEHWLPHYRGLGDAYRMRAILASGTHGDINPGSGGQARGFAEAVIRRNAAPGPHAKYVNAALPMFCKAVDEAEERAPFLPTLSGCFGHSWDVWPVCLAKYAAATREGERQFLAAETLLAVAGAPGDWQATRADRERAEWCLAMLSDHAWNGTGDENKRHNADLRRAWGEALSRLAAALAAKGWAAAGLEPSAGHVTVFNSLSLPRAGLGRIEVPQGLGAVASGRGAVASQVVEEGGRRVLYFVPQAVPGFALETLDLKPAARDAATPDRLRAAPTELDGPFYRLTVDPKTGGIASLVHKASGKELVAPGARTLCQTVYHDGAEHTLSDAKTEVVAAGPVLARLKITGTVAGIAVANLVTVYADIDRVDFDLRIAKPRTTREERLCQVFPVIRQGAVLRVETTGAVIRPRPQPEGDLLPGADVRRFAVQGFVDASAPDAPGVTIAPLDAFVLRQDLDPLTFEALGNDQNYREVVQDQHGVTEFEFRYSLRAHAGPYDNAESFAWSRSVATPLMAAAGRLEGKGAGPGIAVDPTRAIATCLKPADDPASGGIILRLWETAGKGGPLAVTVPGWKKAVRTDLLERDQKELEVSGGVVNVDVRPYGFAALRLTR